MAEGETTTGGGSKSATDSIPTNHENTINDNCWVCFKCKFASSNDDTHMMECDLCERHLCIKCAKVSQTLYKALARVDTMWFCSTACTQQAKTKLCTQNLENQSTQSHDTHEQMLEMEDRIVNNIMKHSKKMNNDLQAELENRIKILDQRIATQAVVSRQILEEYHEESQKTWADIVKKQGETQTKTISNSNQESESFAKIMQEALELSKKEQEIKEERERSIVIFRYRESSIQNRDDRLEEDLKFAKDLCKLGVRAGDIEITKTRRLGKYDKEAERPRPLKVTFETRDQQQKIISNLPNLREAEEAYRKVSINIDMTKQERDEVREKVNEAKRLSQENENKRFIVKGTPGNLRIVEVTKK